MLIVLVSPVNRDCLKKYPIKCAESGCNQTTGFVTHAKAFMDMNVNAQENVTPKDTTVPVWNLL
jgi:hypothetical protein